MNEAVITGERRANGDRRRQPTPPLGLHSLRGRRRLNRRRDGASPGYYVDRYETRWLVVTLATLGLCCIDACATLVLLQVGAREVNPLMELLIHWDVQLFVIVKFSLTAFGLLVLLAHYKFHLLGRISGSKLLLICLMIYSVLVAYEITIMTWYHHALI